MDQMLCTEILITEKLNHSAESDEGMKLDYVHKIV